MFNCCYELENVIPLYYWDVSKVDSMQYIFNGCHKLPDMARLKIKERREFSWFMDQYITPILYPVEEKDEYSEEEEFIDEPPIYTQTWVNETGVFNVKALMEEEEEEACDLSSLSMTTVFKREPI